MRCGALVVPVLPERGGSFAMTVVGAVPRAETGADLDAEHSPGVLKWRAGAGGDGRSRPAAS